MKRIFISDIHLNSDASILRIPNGSYPWGWLDVQGVERFTAFLEWVCASTDVQELVILGDLADNWVCPVGEEPSTFDEIFSARCNQPVVTALRRLVSKNSMRVIYMPGNHDMLVSAGLVSKHFPGMIYGGGALSDCRFHCGRMNAEHGSAYALFNAPDLINNPGTGIPLGYFISRVVATKVQKTGDSGISILRHIDDLLEAIGPKSLAASVLSAVMESAGLSDADVVQMRSENSVTSKVSLGEVKSKYQDLFDQTISRIGYGMAIKYLFAELGYLDDIADRLCKTSGVNAVILGHSHEWALDKDTWFVKDRVYANCGTWCEKTAPCTWVESEKSADGKAMMLRVMDWNNGLPQELKSATVPVRG